MATGPSIPALGPRCLTSIEKGGPLEKLLGHEIRASSACESVMKHVAEKGLGGDHLLFGIPRWLGIAVHEVDESRRIGVNRHGIHDERVPQQTISVKQPGDHPIKAAVRNEPGGESGSPAMLSGGA